MNLVGLKLPAVAALGVCLVAVVLILYTVRFRLPRRIVATTALWRSAQARQRGTGRLGSFDHLLSLILQLVIGAALVLAAAEPRFSCQRAAGRQVMLVLDRSASMGAIERVEPRLDVAKRRVDARLDDLTSTDDVGLVLAGGVLDVAVPLGRDPGAVRAAAHRATVALGPSTLAEAVELACGLVAGAASSSVVVVTDGSEPFTACPTGDFEAVTVGAAHANVGITALAAGVAPRDPTHAEVFVEIENASAEPAKLELRLAIDGSLYRVVPLTLAPGAVEHRIVESVPMTGGHLEARLAAVDLGGANDALAADDEAFVVLPRRDLLPIDLVGNDPIVKLVLSANPRYRVTQRAAGDPSPPDAIRVISGPIVAPLGPGRYLLFDPSGEGAPGTPLGTASEPRITYWRDEHPVLRRVILSDVTVAEARRVKLPPAATPLAGDDRTPLLYALDDGKVRAIGLTFAPGSSDLPLRVGFPVLVYNAIDWLAGERRRGAAASTVVHSAPGGFLVPGGGESAANVASRGETELSPRAEIAVPERRGPSEGLRDRAAWPWLVALALLGLAVEWFTFHRRWTV